MLKKIGCMAALIVVVFDKLNEVDITSQLFWIVISAGVIAGGLVLYPFNTIIGI